MINHVFTIWLTDKDWDGMPLLNEICIASAQVYFNKPVTIYTNHKLHLSFLDRRITHIEQIPDTWMEDAIQYCGDNKAHQSDYLRLCYLSEKPSMYFDTDILFWDDMLALLENEMYATGSNIIYLKEDKYMITNCLIACKDPIKAGLFFKDMLWNYRNRFIKGSYLFNSQKYMNLMEQRHIGELECFNFSESLFSIKWNAENSMEFFYEDKPPLSLGQHLFNSNKEWDWINKAMTMNIYNVNPEEWPFKVTKDVIDKYINLMMEEDKRC